MVSNDTISLFYYDEKLPLWALRFFNQQSCQCCLKIYQEDTKAFFAIIFSVYIRQLPIICFTLPSGEEQNHGLQRYKFVVVTSRICGRGNVFVMSVCLCVCVCLSVWAITFDIDIKTSFLVWWYILTISRSSLSIKVIGSRSRSSYRKC